MSVITALDGWIRSKYNIPSRETLDKLGFSSSVFIWGFASRIFCLWVAVALPMFSIYSDQLFGFELLHRSGALMVAFAIYCAFANSHLSNLAVQARAMEDEMKTGIRRYRLMMDDKEVRDFKLLEGRISEIREYLEGYYAKSYALETAIAVFGTLIWGFGDLVTTEICLC